MGYILGTTVQELTFEALLAALQAVYPGTESDGEYFTNRIARQEAIALQRGWPLDGPPLQSTRDAAARLGPQPSFKVPVNSSLFFSGRFSTNGVLLHANRPFTAPEIESLSACLIGLGMSLETYTG